MVLVATLIASLVWLIWVKELHHLSPHLQILSQALLMPAIRRAHSSHC